MRAPIVELEGVWLRCSRRDAHAPHMRAVPGGEACCPGVGYVVLRSEHVRGGGRSYPGCHDWPLVERRWMGRWPEGEAPDYDTDEARQLAGA